MKTFRAVLGFWLAATNVTLVQAQTEQSDGLQGYVSVGAGLMPDYEGASKYIVVLTSMARPI